MNVVAQLKQSLISRFLDRCGPGIGDRVQILENSTEEIHEARKSGKPIKMFARGRGMLATGRSGAKARLEENYLFDTRRFPSFVTGEAFPVTLAAGEYLFFGSAIGQPAANNGFAPIVVPVMTDTETNMDTASQIPQGKDYVMTQLGVSFNADITPADAATLMESGAIRFSKQGGQYTLKHGPPRLWPGGTGLSGFISQDAIAAPSTLQFGSNGSPDIRAVRRLAVPRILEQKDTFSYLYVVPRNFRNISGATDPNQLSAGCIMTIWLWGGQQDAIPV